MSPVKWKIGIVIAVVLGTLAWLAFTGIRSSATYYVTVSELKAKAPAAGDGHRLRVDGQIAPGSIKPHTGHVDFILQQGKDFLPVSYVGTEPPPDTFVDNAQAMATGHLLPNGTFEATAIQAKCASKYEPKGARSRGKMRTSAGTM